MLEQGSVAPGFQFCSQFILAGQLNYTRRVHDIKTGDDLFLLTAPSFIFLEPLLLSIHLKKSQMVS